MVSGWDAAACWRLLETVIEVRWQPLEEKPMTMRAAKRLNMARMLSCAAALCTSNRTSDNMFGTEEFMGFNTS